MKKLQENINRIKELMLVENDNQLSLFTGDDGNPISINSNEFTLNFKDEVHSILKDLYSNEWDSDPSRGPAGKGGVVGVHTVYDLLNKKGLTDYDPQGGDWSILNYFDTNPQVRRFIVWLYEKETGNILANKKVMDDFISWMKENKERLFKDGPILNKLIEKNTESLYQGELNERKAYDYLSKILENLPDWKLRGRSVPGSKTDRDGIDFVMEHVRTGRLGKFQVKPLNEFEKVRNSYKIKSYNIRNLDKKPVDYFIFASNDKEDIYIFKNEVGKYTILDNDTVQFEEPPIKF